MALGVQPDPKWGAYVLCFAFFNLFVTCVKEELFFRCILQEGIQHLCCRFIGHRQLSTLATLGLSALIFTAAHFHTGPGAPLRLLLIFLAGILYALVYQLTRSVSLAIVTHFIVNLLHFSLFTYPTN